MKNATTNEFKGLTIPNEILEVVGFAHAITLTAFKDVIALSKTEMTALEMINTIEGLEHIIISLYNELVANFPKNEEYGNCPFCEECMDENVEVPDWAKELAGIDRDTKLSISVVEDSERIILEPIGYAFDLTDVSDEIAERLSDMGVCLGKLNESIKEEEIIHG